MKITGSMNYIIFDLEDGYVMKAEGEMLMGRKFLVYKNTMNAWEKPHENELVDDCTVTKIIQEVEKRMNENTVQIIFE